MNENFLRRTAVAVVHVNVTDVNNNVPEFVGAPYEAQVGESLPAGALVTQVSVSIHTDSHAEPFWGVIRLKRPHTIA